MYFWRYAKKSLKKSREKREAELIALKEHHNDLQGRFVDEFIKTETETKNKIDDIPAPERNPQEKDKNGINIPQITEPLDENNERQEKENDKDDYPESEQFK